MQLFLLHRDRPTKTISESLVSDFLMGTMLKAKNFLAGVPKEVRQDTRIKKLLEIANQSKENLFNVTDWWLELGKLIDPDNAERIADETKKVTQERTADWVGKVETHIQKQSEEEQFQKKYATLKAKLQRRQALGKLREKYVTPYDVYRRRMRVGRHGERPGRHDRGDVLKQLADIRRNLEGMREGKQINEEGFLGGLLDLVAGGHKKIVQRHMMKSLNSLIANTAIAYAIELKKKKEKTSKEDEEYPSWTEAGTD